MSSNYNLLITGAARGIGRELAATWLSKPNNTVIAAVRDTTASAAKSLASLPTGPGSKLIIVKIDSVKQSDAANAVEELQSKHSINHLDLVIANAGAAWSMPLIVELEIPDLIRHLEVNNFGLIWLFQATIALLEKAKAPTWVSVSSVAGTLGDMHKMPHKNAAYGASKAITNFHTLKMHFEHEKVAAFAIHPGWVQTEMGNDGARRLGFEQAPNTLEEVVPPLYSLIHGATRDTHSGRFWNFDGAEVAW